MSLVASVIMGASGVSYCILGVCMLFHFARGPVLGWLVSSDFAELYSVSFRQLANPVQSPSQHHAKQEAQLEPDVDQGELGPPPPAPSPPSAHLLAYRFLAYLLLLLGVCRVITCFYWGCGYVYLGLGSCVGEIALICNELLRFESMHLHGAMALLLETVVLALLYIGTAVPYCQS
jgi:hypothetical protein